MVFERFWLEIGYLVFLHFGIKWGIVFYTLVLNWVHCVEEAILSPLLIRQSAGIDKGQVLDRVSKCCSAPE